MRQTLVLILRSLSNLPISSKTILGWFSDALIHNPVFLIITALSSVPFFSFPGEEDEESSILENLFLECVKGNSSLGEYNKRF